MISRPALLKRGGAAGIGTEQEHGGDAVLPGDGRHDGFDVLNGIDHTFLYPHFTVCAKKK